MPNGPVKKRAKLGDFYVNNSYLIKILQEEARIIFYAILEPLPSFCYLCSLIQNHQ